MDRLLVTDIIDVEKLKTAFEFDQSVDWDANSIYKAKGAAYCCNEINDLIYFSFKNKEIADIETGNLMDLLINCTDWARYLNSVCIYLADALKDY